jgi:DNA-binding transcriptional regulator LsrR (DeoR family)
MLGMRLFIGNIFLQKYNNGMRQFQIAKELKLKPSSVRAVIQKARRNNSIIKNYG